MNRIKNIIQSFYPTFIFIFVFVFLLCPYCVRGSSMYPYLEHNDKILIDKISTKLNKLERFDIIVFHNDKDDLVKRIIGLPGETIQIKNSIIYINNEELTDNYKCENNYEAINAQYKITLKEDEYFVLGDNRNYSIDSRYDEVGIVTKGQIIGKFLCKF